MVEFLLLRSGSLSVLFWGVDLRCWIGQGAIGFCQIESFEFSISVKVWPLGAYLVGMHGRFWYGGKSF